MPDLVLKARWILPVVTPPIENGRIVIEAGRITGVEAAGHRRPDIDFGDAVIIPGLINAHTHTELSDCRGRLSYRGSFVQWLEDLLRLRSESVNASNDSSQATIRSGLDEMCRAGVTAAADIGHGASALAGWANAPIHHVGFLEVLGMGARRQREHERSLALAESLLQEAPAPDHTDKVRRLSRIGLSPHAPYSTAPELYEAALKLARRQQWPLCTHLAETREEIRFLQDGTGPFRDLLERLGLWDGTFEPPGVSPVAYARQLGLLTMPSLLAHVNYVSADDLDILAAGAASVVYCPRTHAYFQHEPHPCRRMLDSGINVCLGTDSLAGSDTLSILDELRFLRAQDRNLPGDLLLQMATLNGARALGWEEQTGSIAPGQWADLAVLPLSEPAADPIEDLLQSQTRPVECFVQGKPLLTG